MPVKDLFSLSQDTLFGVSQGSILWPLLFDNIFLTDLFFTLDKVEIANHLHEATLYVAFDKICLNNWMIIS